MFGSAPTYDSDVKTCGGKWCQTWRSNVKKDIIHKNSLDDISLHRSVTRKFLSGM